MQPKQVFKAYDQPSSGQEDKGLFRFCPRCGQPLVKCQVAGRERPYCPNCGYVQFRNPLSAVSVLICQGDKILLGKEGQ